MVGFHALFVFMILKERDGSVRYDYNRERWQKVEVKGIPCLFSDIRIDRRTVPEGKYMYEVADACDGIPCRMRQGILVNFYGTIICDQTFQPDEGDTVYLDDEDWNFAD